MEGQISYIIKTAKFMINEWKRSVQERAGAAKINVGEPFNHLDAYIIVKTEFGRNYEE